MIGARLRQARLLAGMTQKEVANSLGEVGYDITAAAISKYEKSQSFPPAQFLLLASSVLDVPSAYFSHQPAKTVEWLAFRCRKRLSQRERNKIKVFASDVAELQIELRELLYPNPELPLPSLPVATLDDAQNAAGQLRKLWKVGDRPLDNLVQTAEDRNVIVIGWKDETGLFDGLSGQCDGRPIAVINTNVPTDRQRLSLAHEIGHLVMDVDEKSEFDEEQLAYRFAAALLVPEDHAYRELGIRRNHLNWGELESLKRKYGMSMAAWLMRGRDLGIITENRYIEMYKEFSSRGWRTQEPEEYLGDEEPLQLRQMAQRAVAEGLISPDRVTRVAVDVLESESYLDRKSEYPNALELLEMDDDERDMWMSKMFELAENMEFEVFEAYGQEDLEAW